MGKKDFLFNFIERVFILLAGIQIALGFAWMAGNIMHVPDFAESMLYIQASKDFVLDEYMGILYPLLIRMTGIAGNYFCVALYLIQIIAAFGAYYYFIKKIFAKHRMSRRMICLFAAYVVTFPVILQVHMSVLPYSMASSVWLILLAMLKELLTQVESLSWKRVVCIGGCWSIGALLLPEYGLLTGIIVAVGFVICGWKKKARWRILLLTAFVAISCVGVTLTFAQTPGSLGRIQKSMGATMLSRFAWPYIERNSFFWSEEIHTVFDAQDLRSISMYPEKICYEFGPRLEKEVGKARANTLYWEMATDSLLLGKKDALAALGRDVVQNIGGPIGIQLQWQGLGVSYAGWNYACMSQHTPELAKYYVRFANYVFDFMLLWIVVIFWLQRRQYHGFLKETWKWLLLLTVFTVTIWYTMTGNGMQDYIKILPTNILWCMLPIWKCMGHMKED